MRLVTCEMSRYYDLIELPHGHIPAPKVKFWRKIPIPIGRQRNEEFYQCSTCGMPSFFKTFSCDYCDEMDYPDSDFSAYRKRERKKMRWKKIEYALLPLLVLFGKVKYNQSTRTHHTDSDYSWIEDCDFTFCSQHERENQK